KPLKNLNVCFFEPISAIESSWSPRWMILSIDFGQKPLSNEIYEDCQGGMASCEVGLRFESDGFVCRCNSRGGEGDE
ncbi:hypothetical protein Tco_0093952, partial [Tanacetum coccineum]